MKDCSSVEPLLAALAFDALDDVERPAVERHLAECEHCRAAHARLVGLPALLDIAGSADVKIHAPPPLLEAALVAGLPGHGGRLRSGPRLNLRRRGSPRARAGTLLGLLAVAAVLIAPVVLTGRPDQGLRLALTASAQGVGAAGVASLRVHPWGTEVDLEAHGLAPTRGAEIYEVWFVSDRARIRPGRSRSAHPAGCPFGSPARPTKGSTPAWESPANPTRRARSDEDRTSCAQHSPRSVWRGEPSHERSRCRPEPRFDAAQLGGSLVARCAKGPRSRSSGPSSESN